MSTMLKTIEKYQTRLEIIEQEAELSATVLGKTQKSPELLRGAGFTVFVQPSFALAFKYTASIFNLAQELYDVHSVRSLVVDAREDPKSRWMHSFTNGGRSGPVLFKGKIPLWVINKVRLAVGMGICDITIHSNDKAIEKDIVTEDPVIVGWVGFSPLFDWLIKNKGKMPRWYYSARMIQPKNPFGFIIAIFGGEDVI